MKVHSCVDAHIYTPIHVNVSLIYTHKRKKKEKEGGKEEGREQGRKMTKNGLFRS